MSKMNSFYIGQPVENLLEIKEFYTFFDDILPPNHKSFGERHDFYEMFVIYEGSARVTVGNNSFHINKGELYVYTPGVFHIICNDDKEEKNCHLQIMSFSAEYFPKTRGVYNLSQEKIDELKQLSTAFHECFRLLSLSDIMGGKFKNSNRRAFVRGIESKREHDISILKKKFEIFLLEILSSNNASVPVEKDEPQDALSIILSALKDNLYGRITTTDIAKITMMSVPYIEKTIQSVIDQTYQNWELIIVDDCSTDNSVEIIESFHDDRIRLLHNLENSGAAVSRNHAIREANGRWIAFLDSDDLWASSKLLAHLQFMLETGAVLSFTDYTVVDSDETVITDFVPNRKVYDYRTILKHCYIGCSTAIYDAEKLGRVYMPENAEKREDFACWLSILRDGKTAECFHQSLTTYRVHTKSVSSNKMQMIKYQWNVYRKVEKLSIIKSAYYMMHWAIKGVLKYR